MKKFLTMLLALSVVFTYTFGAAGSVFAAGSASYTAEQAEEILDAAYTSAVATEFDVDYDTTNTTANDITVFTVDKTAVQAGIYAAYQTAKNAISGTGINTIAGADVNGTKAADIAAVRVALETAAVSNAATFDTAFDAYKAELTSIVNAISTEKYTTTSYEDLGVSKFTSKNGNSYATSKEAADADKQWALDAIAKAEFSASGDASASTVAKWSTSYENLYTKVFGEVFTLIENKDDVTDANKVTSVSYDLKNSALSTTAEENAATANLAVQKAQAKATLVSVITTFEVSPAYKDAYANAIAAYKECMEYLIDNATTDPTGLVGTAISAATATTVKLGTGEPVDYVARTATAAQVKADAASNKQIAEIQGAYYDDAKAEKALVAVLKEVYDGQAYSNQAANGKVLYSAVAKLTAGEKAALKDARDYSEVYADENGKYKFKTYNTGTKADAYYYAKEFEAVKAAVDAYCAAIDKAETQLDVNDAEDAFKEATLEKNIKKAGTVDGIFTSLDSSLVSAYFNKVKGTKEIYITWNGGETYDSAFDADHYKAFVIEKGARTLKEADALYADACAIIDAYKTKAQLTTEAAAVQAKIEALPTTIALADKAAVADAAKAYTDLAEGFRGYVANATKLKNAVKKLENLEAAEVIKLINALPALSKVTVADKTAIKAAVDAYNAWYYEEMYDATGLFVTSRTTVTDITGTGSYADKIQAVERQALTDAYTPLGAKWAVDAITLADADAVKALQGATAAYIADYNEAVEFEANLEKIAAVIAALEKAEVEANKWTDKDVKAAMYDVAKTTSYTKPSKTSVKLTAKANVAEIKENGYTVKYRFYQKGPKKTSYKLWKTSTSSAYTFKGLKKGTHSFKVKVSVYDAEGKLVAYKYTNVRTLKIK